MIELRGPSGDGALAAQVELAERMLLGALHEQDSAERARTSERRAAFLAQESSRLAKSIDEPTALRSVAGLRLPAVAAWCIVDVIEEGGGSRRLAVVHPDPEKQAFQRDVLGESSPRPGEPFSLEAVRDATESVALLGGGARPSPRNRGMGLPTSRSARS